MMDLDAIIAKVTTGKPQKKQKKPSEGPLRIVRYIDYFKLREAPFVLEERLSSSGHTYTAKVYLPEAYTDAYMEPSDETGRLLRWGVRLSDGRTVSRDGAFRVRFPERWARIAGKLQRARGERRHQLAAEELWKAMTPEERKALLDIDLSAYIEGAGERQARAALEADLKDSGSLLWLARDVIKREDFPSLRDAYATRYLGGPILSPEYNSAPWNRWLDYSMALRGLHPPGWSLEEAIEAIADPHALPLLRATTQPENRWSNRTVTTWPPHPWLSSLREYTRHGDSTDDFVRAVSVRMLRPAIARRFRGLPSRQEAAGFPGTTNVDIRKQWWANANARLDRMNPEDRKLLITAGVGKALPTVLGTVRHLTGD